MAVFIICILFGIITDNFNNILCPVIILVTGFFLFLLNIIAAGDVKLAVAFSIAVNPKYQLLVITIILLLGGVVALCQLIWNEYKSDGKVNGVPYGVPICIGYLFGIAASI
ncbi:prepilin peptidase [Aliivibrio sifiae]|nr:prepilin peptidase [Aliivibrio sifiae]